MSKSSRNPCMVPSSHLVHEGLEDIISIELNAKVLNGIYLGPQLGEADQDWIDPASKVTFELIPNPDLSIATK
ncbi:MAG: hypothetical protein CM15mP49_03890 [Actinomycetota bacterium]|nr:MAG: hypothetical protein CM15mP49_03890 [Actinomycetota bacterium]